MHARLIAAAVLAVLTASCSGGLYDTADFMTARSRAAAKTAGAAAPGDTAADTATEGNAAESGPAEAASAEGAAPDAPSQDPAPPTAGSDSSIAAAPAPAAPPSGGLLAFFRGAAPATPAAAGAAAAIDQSTPEEPVEEITEAELAGEVEADPAKLPVPEEPVNDGLEHDFVNVYTSKPELIQPLHEGLPGVAWEGGLVLVSRTPDGDDPSSLFGGGDHPFARSVPGIPRQTIQAANGLLLAHSAINVNCVKSDLLGLVRRAESHFGRKVVVTSGYRSPVHNRRVRGAKHSQHMYCNALDLYMPGVARDDLARFFFAQPDRGGIGLYCHTRSIHVDTGKRRQWRWACRRG